MRTASAPAGRANFPAPQKTVASPATARKIAGAIKPEPDIAPRWFGRLTPRLKAHWLTKATVIPLFVTGFFAAYFHLLRHPLFPVATMPLLAPDRWIGFSPLALAPYLSLWLYVFLATALVRGRDELRAYLIGIVVITATGLGLFLVWPTAIVRPALDWTKYPGFGFLNTIDTSGNACPSLHVAFAVFSAVWLEHLFRATAAPRRPRILNVVWCTLIVHSTLATKQHVTVDAVAGTALGLAGALWLPREPARSQACFHPLCNRQTLAFLVSLSAKLVIVALNLWPGHILVSLALFCGPDLWILTGLLIPNATWILPRITGFVPKGREVWLTIDDGPEPATTRPMLDLLDRHGAKATFFVIGENAAAHPTLIGEILARGHTLGNHTHTHPLATFWMAGPGRTNREIDGCAAALDRAGASSVVWFRPPVGIGNLFLRRTLARRGLVLIGWRGRGREQFSTTPEQPLRRLRRRLRPGAILLVHESASHAGQRLALLASLLEHLTAQGYRCVLPGRDALR